MMVNLSFDLNVPKDSSNTNESAQNGGTPKSVTFEIHYGGCFTSTPSRSYVGGQDNKIILVYVEHESSNVDSSIFVTLNKGDAIGVDNHLRKAPIEIDSSPDVNRNLTPMCHRNLTKEWEQVSSKLLSICKVMKILSKKQPASSVEGPIVVESANDPFEDLDEILSDYANTMEQITEDEITEDLDYDPNHDEVFDDDEHIVEDVSVSMNNSNFTADPKHDLTVGRVKCDQLLNNISEVFNRQLVDGRDQPIITCLKYIREYLMKRIIVVPKVKAKTVGPLTPSVTVVFDAIKKLLSTLFNGMERKKSHDEIASQSCSPRKLFGKGGSVKCSKCGNLDPNKKVCRDQGGASQNVGFSQAGAAPSIINGARNASRPALSQACQGPMQGFQASRPAPSSRPQRLTKKTTSRHSLRKLPS
uniref:Uncharacterized protein n=1 Tax=Tanacetum cinerariifolium TaxID=118510 RepID=A0A699GMF7_TANCI|nr:hypothetical protein [Tanacetum cinerariifolium]